MPQGSGFSGRQKKQRTQPTGKNTPTEWLRNILVVRALPEVKRFSGRHPAGIWHLLKMLDRWNAHDIEGYLEVYWKSPELLVVVDAEQFNGWQQLHDSYVIGYPDRVAKEFIQPKRIQV